MTRQDPTHIAETESPRLEAAEVCARLLRDHLTGDGGFGGKPTRLECEGCSSAVRAWERLHFPDDGGGTDV